MRPETLRNIFLILFMASTLALVLLIGPLNNLSIQASETAIPGTEIPGITTTAEPGDTSEDPSHSPSGNLNSTALIGSLITSATSLIGFITTTVITWRKEKREASLADVERQRLETELEKSRLELEELKRGREKKEARRKK